MSEGLHPATAGINLAAIYNRVEHHIEQRYGVPVWIADVVADNNGDVNGAEIKIDFDQEIEIALFVLIHLFGHTVQWNTSETDRQLGLDNTPGKSEEELARIGIYERDATRYSLSLLHDLNIHHLDRWVSDWWYADWRYLQHFYRTGQKLHAPSLLLPGEGALLTPLPIPSFQPQRYVSRWSF